MSPLPFYHRTSCLSLCSLGDSNAWPHLRQDFSPWSLPDPAASDLVRAQRHGDALRSPLIVRMRRLGGLLFEIVVVVNALHPPTFDTCCSLAPCISCLDGFAAFRSSSSSCRPGFFKSQLISSLLSIPAFLFSGLALVGYFRMCFRDGLSLVYLQRSRWTILSLWASARPFSCDPSLFLDSFSPLESLVSF